jgi:hypothetical protein
MELHRKLREKKLFEIQKQIDYAEITLQHQYKGLDRALTTKSINPYNITEFPEWFELIN